MSGLSREVIKWLQTLDLSWQIKNPKWDLSNGYLVAEMFSWYYPQEILMHSFYNRNSLELKKKNWYLLKNFILKNNFDLRMEDVDGTIHSKDGAAVQLLESMYEILTNKRAKRASPEAELDYTDYSYQLQLPMYARSTASKAVKNNIRLTEIMADQNLTHYEQKSQKIINDHIEHRRLERRVNPHRFGIKPTLGDHCIRRYEFSKKLTSEATYLSNTTDIPGELAADSTSKQPLTCETSVHFNTANSSTEPPLTPESSIHYKEIEVKQPNKSYQLPLQSY